VVLHPVPVDGDAQFLSLTTAGFTRVSLAAAGLPDRPGNVGKGSLRGPGDWTLDFPLAKSIRLGERYRLGCPVAMFKLSATCNHRGGTFQNVPVIPVTPSRFCA
jgi:hypothetical protein